jgi:alkylhydroperoxidase family enzyme
MPTGSTSQLVTASNSVRSAVAELAPQMKAMNALEAASRKLAELIWVIAIINTWNRFGATAHAWPLS